METLVITVRDKAKRGQIEELLQDIDGVERIQHIRTPDEATLISQTSLAEEWDSPEDQRWDSLL